MMKRIALILGAFFAFTAFAAAQVSQDRLQQQPPPITQAQVERDAELAREERKRDEEARKAQEEKQRKQQQEALTATTDNTIKRTSRPGKQ